MGSKGANQVIKLKANYNGKYLSGACFAGADKCDEIIGIKMVDGSPGPAEYEHFTFEEVNDKQV